MMLTDTHAEAHAQLGGDSQVQLSAVAGGLHIATSGFELVSCTVPASARWPGETGGVPGRFDGDAELGADLHFAFLPLLADLPAGAALVSEYLFAPMGEGGVEIRQRLLMRSQPLPAAEAAAQVTAACGRLAICLRVLADWYAFQRVEFSAADRRRWGRRRAALRAQPRLFAVQAVGRIGFGAATSGSGARRILLPQPVDGQAHLARPGEAALLLRAGAAGSLLRCLRAARGLSEPFAIRLGLVRRDLSGQDQESLRDLAGKVTAAMHDDTANDEVAEVSGIAAGAALEAVEALLSQPRCLEILVEATADREDHRALLSLLWQECFPGFACEFAAGSGPGGRDGQSRHRPVDVSQVLLPGSLLPPIMPAPPVMESLGFARHYANPSVLFPDDGMHLGRAQVGGVMVDVRMPHADRSRHTYVLGATGTGKSTLLFNMAVQDMLAGHGLALVDPHGDLFEQILLAVPPQRRGDLWIIDIDDPLFRPCLNPLDLGPRPDAVAANRVANDMLEIFDQLYDMQKAGGPVFEDYFRHGLLLAAAGPAGGPHPSYGPVPTLASMISVFRDREWRAVCMSRLDEFYGEAGMPIKQFFASAAKISGDHAMNNIQGYITAKLTRFVNSVSLNRLFCAGRRTVDFRRLMDEGRILLINLSKGDLGSGDSRFVGMLLTKYLFQAALSRSDMPRDQRRPFHFYLDEFQNFVASDVPEMLAEARKYGLYLTLANQTLGQLGAKGQRDIIDAVLGNAATRLFFRTGQQEAELVESSFTPYFDRRTLLHLPDRHVLCRLLIGNQHSLPFVFSTSPAIELPGDASETRSREWALVNMTPTPEA